MFAEVWSLKSEKNSNNINGFITADVIIILSMILTWIESSKLYEFTRGLWLIWYTVNGKIIGYSFIIRGCIIGLDSKIKIVGLFWFNSWSIFEIWIMLIIGFCSIK